MLTKEQMTNSMLKDYYDKGHWFDALHGYCVNCGRPVIDITEDAMYQELPECSRNFT